MNLADELRKLSELREAGHLTDQEFADAKRRLLAEADAQPPEVTTPPPIPQQSPRRKKSGPLRTFLQVIVLVFGVIIFLNIIGSWSRKSGSQPGSSASPSNVPVATTDTSAQPAAAPVATAQERTISWREIDSIYNLKSKQTDLQKNETWKRYKGQRVTWSGQVTSVSEGWFGGLTLQVKMNRDTFTSDLLINLKKTEKAKAAQLQQGDQVRFTGILSTWGSLLPITLDDGEIIQ